MRIQPTRGGRARAAAALCGIATIATVALWRAEPRPGHAGQRYFTRLTVIYTGSRTYLAGGTLHQLPLTATDPLSPYGGA